MVKLSHSILQSVLKPSRYTGGELNSVIKDWNNIGATIALSMPDVYEVGMSNLGLQILYEIVNSSENFVAERVYAPWIDMEDLMRENDIPLFSLESRREIISFDLLGFSLQYEMIYTNVLNMLDLAKIPLYSKERSIDMPFVVGGGPCVYNVEPIADFFDFFIIGEGEEVILEVLAMMSEWKSSGKQGGRKGFLELIMSISGVYVPQYYKPQYNSDGCFVQMQALSDKAKIPVYKRVVANLNNVKFLDKPIVPNMDIIHNRLMLELFRGCSKGCRFCQAGMCYRPVRERSKEKLINLSKSLVDSTGYDEMSLTSLSSADYSCLDDLVDNLMVEFQQERVSFSLPSLRIDSFSVDLAYKMQQIRKSGLTFAPEAGTQRLRDVINKGVTEEDLLKACAAAFRQGWKKVKLYFMMGLPTETDEDILGIADLGKKVVDLYTSIVGHRGCNVTISVSCLVPKPFTPFQWFGQLPVAEFQRRQRLLKEAIKDKAITFNYHDAKLSIIEGIMARGDRRLSKVIYTAWKNGAKFDGWSDLFKFEVWDEALRECNINGEYYSERNRDMCEALPWSHTSPGVTERFLYNEWQKAMLASLTIDCRREVCTGCGVCPQLQVNIIDFYDKKNRKNI